MQVKLFSTTQRYNNSSGTVTSRGRVLGGRHYNIEMATKTDMEFARIKEDFEFLKAQANTLQDMVCGFEDQRVSETWIIQAAKFERNVAIFTKSNSFYIALEYCNTELEKFVLLNKEVIKNSRKPILKPKLQAQNEVSSKSDCVQAEPETQGFDHQLEVFQDEVRNAMIEQWANTKIAQILSSKKGKYSKHNGNIKAKTKRKYRSALYANNFANKQDMIFVQHAISQQQAIDWFFDEETYYKDLARRAFERAGREEFKRIMDPSYTFQNIDVFDYDNGFDFSGH
jgi:hypothetical protein